VGCRNGVDQHSAESRRRRKLNPCRRSLDDRGLGIDAQPTLLLPNGNEFTFGSANPYFPAGKAGRLVGGSKTDGDAAAAKAKADGLFRVWSTIMSDPAAFPMLPISVNPSFLDKNQ